MSRSKCLFVDMDGVVFDNHNQGPENDEWIPGALEKLKALQKDWFLVAFTSRPPGEWMQRLTDAGVRFEGYFHKPLADEYGWVDDHLNQKFVGTSLEDLNPDG